MTVGTEMARPDLRAAPARRVRLSGQAAEALDMGRVRLAITGVVFALAFVAVGARLFDLSVIAVGDQGRPMAAPAAYAPVARADITDRNGVLLATSVPTASLFADPALVIDADEAARRLTAILPELDPDWLRGQLDTDRRFVWIKRGLTPTEQYEINRLGIPGLAFQSEERRVYPTGALSSHIVGYTDVDGAGLTGMELTLDGQLRGAQEPVALSLDVRLQEVLREEIAAAMDEFQAIGGAGVILDVDSGELLAMVSLPDFNPYDRADAPEEERFNRSTLGLYEMGSTFKIFTTAMALDAGVTSVTSGYDATHPIRVGRFTINDFHPESRWLTVPEIFMYSSNIGSVHMALDLGTAGQQDYLRRLGLLDPSPVEMPEVGRPLVPDPWREVNTMTIAFGHGLAVSPVQLAGAVAATVNGGIMRPTTLLHRTEATPPAGERVISEATSDTVRRLLRLVVQNGTGRNADAEGYLVGGKTGTAEKVSGNGYARSALVSSFVAAFPMNDPRYVIFVMLDEPRGNERTFGYATGGWVAAPVVRHVVERIGPMVGLMPIDADAPDIQEALYVAVTPEERRVTPAVSP